MAYSVSVFQMQPLTIASPQIPLEIRRRNVYFVMAPFDGPPCSYEGVLPCGIANLTLGIDALVHYEQLYWALSAALSNLDIAEPDRHGVINQIMSFWTLGPDGLNVPACLEVTVSCEGRDGYGPEMSRAAAVMRQWQGDGMVPSSDAAVRALKMAPVKSSGMSCTVCLEELPERSIATRMPCSHLFHRRCIVRWLRSSHFCPVCRHEMPTA